jgi:hypothetical protein
MSAVTAAFLSQVRPIPAAGTGGNLPDFLQIFLLIIGALFVLAFIGAVFLDVKEKNYEGAGCLCACWRGNEEVVAVKREPPLKTSEPKECPSFCC